MLPRESFTIAWSFAKVRILGWLYGGGSHGMISGSPGSILSLPLGRWQLRLAPGFGLAGSGGK